MNSAQRAALNAMMKVAEEMNRELFLPPLNQALRDDLSRRWVTARNRYFELEHEAKQSRAAQQMARKGLGRKSTAGR